MKSSKKTQVPISFERQMEALVCLNHKVDVDMEGDHYIRLKVHLKLSASAKFFRFFSKVRDYRKYLLTDFNYTLYCVLREKPMRIKDLVRWLADREKLSFYESRTIVLQYVGLLMRRGLAAVELPPEEASAEG